MSEPNEDVTPTSEAYPGAETFFPARRTLPSLRKAAAGCRGCPLYRDATQTVFGEGPTGARVMLIGEMPGNDEDLEGRPFVGPAGRLLDDALQEAGITRDDAYVTNVVKHFKWEPRGKRRLHRSPGAREVRACLPWLDAEIERVRPRILVALGATAARTLFGSSFRITRDRGEFMPSPRAEWATATIHPSAILRQRSREERHAEMRLLVRDLGRVSEVLNGR